MSLWDGRGDGELDRSAGLEQLLGREQIGVEAGHVECVLENDMARASC